MISRRISHAFLLFCFILISGACTQQNDKGIPEVDTEISADNGFVLPPLPDTVLFCGKAIALENFDMRERLDKEIIVNTFYHSSTIQSLKRANRYFETLEKTLRQEDVPDDFKYLCLIESGLTQAVSPAGARGFWQFMPKTAKEYGLRVDKEVDERLHIEKSTIAACNYLKDANAKFEDWILVAASYNMGMGGVQSALTDQEVGNYFDLHLNNETRRYVFRILALKIIFENLEAYGFNKDELELYNPIDVRSIELTETTDSLKHWAKEQGTTFRMLKILNPWIKGDKLTIKNETITVDLPK